MLIVTFPEIFRKFWGHLRRFEAYVPPRLPELAERYGYELRQGQGHHMCLSRPILREANFAYAQQIQGPGHPINLLGIGPSARSAIFGIGSFQAAARTGISLSRAPINNQR